MRVRLLGPVDVVTGGRVRPVSGLRRRAVLAVLATHGGAVVSTDRLIDHVWGDGAPLTALNTLQRHISYLRQVLGDRAAIVARSPGYVLEVGSEAVDVQLAERLIRKGTRCADHIDRIRHLQAALGLWRGRPLADLAGLSWAEDQARHLDRIWLDATRALTHARLALGEHALVLPDLQRLAQSHPFDEQTHAQLMLALYRTGQQAEALEVYLRVRGRLAEDLGIEPGRDLADLQAGILRQDSSLDLAPAPAALTVVAPAQLPAAVPAFAGRSREIARLESLLTDPAPVVVSAVLGTAGVGKTALAVHWAHHVADRFPDGQLYVNLRGYDPSGTAMEPSDVVRRFLDAFGVPAEQVPADPEGQLSLYRSQLAGKRVLVLLDNARDSAQVRPLLPGATSLVLVTSRTQLTGLVATDGAHAVNLDLLSRDEAVELLSGRLGVQRVAAEPAAVDEIIERCARLPLALAIVAARAATQPRVPLRTLAAELRDSRRLDTLTTDDPSNDVRAVFFWSYRTLSSAAARLFRLLALHPGPDITVAAAASLAGVAVAEARAQLVELSRANLVTEFPPGRYTSHDLLRTYARELAERTDDATYRRNAGRRVMDHYLHTAYLADELLDPARDREVFTLGLVPISAGVTVEPLSDHAQALAWFDAERSVLLAAIDQAAANGWDRHTWQLAWVIATYCGWQGHWHDQVTACVAGIAAAERLADPVAQAFGLRAVAGAYTRMGHFELARTRLRQALALSLRTGDKVGQAHAHGVLAHLLQREGRYHEVLYHERQALELYRATDRPVVAALTLVGIAWSQAHLGDNDESLDLCQEGLHLLQEFGDQPGEACAWNCLGLIRGNLGDHVQSAYCYRHAIRLFATCGDRYRVAVTRARLGDALNAIGSRDEARDSWREALVTLDELHWPNVEQIRGKLAMLDSGR